MQQSISSIKTALVRLRLVTRTWVGALVLAFALAFLSAPAHAVRDGEKALIGPFGATTGEVVRVSVHPVVNSHTLPWEFVIFFFDVSGQKFREFRLQQEPGTIGFAEVFIRDEDNLPADPLGRRTLRVEIVGFNPQPDPPGVWSATVELVNARTGRTAVFLGGPDTVLSAPPEPDFPAP